MSGAARVIRSACASVAAVALAACNVGPRDDVTWADVRPLLEKSCLECHGAASPRGDFSTYEGARDNAHAMLTMIEAQLMPPGGIDRSGACNEFVGPRPLGDDEVETLRAWIDARMPRGATATAETQDARRPQGIAPENHADVDATVTFSLDASPEDTQRCVLVDIDGAASGEGAYLVGVHMRAPRALHHAMVFTLSDGAPEEPSLDAWNCDGVPRGPDGELAQLAFAWTPGRDAVSFPDDTGVALTPRVIVQWHEYGPLDDEHDDERSSATATLTLRIARSVVSPLSIVPVALAGFSLAPGDDVVIARPVPLPEGVVVGVMPHLHQAGRSLSLTAGEQHCIVDAPRYDFAFQEVAFFTQPLTIAENAVGTLTCAWDTSERTQPTRWGERSSDEMCTAFLFVAQ